MATKSSTPLCMDRPKGNLTGSIRTWKNGIRAHTTIKMTCNNISKNMMWNATAQLQKCPLSDERGECQPLCHDRESTKMVAQIPHLHQQKHKLH